MRVIIAFALGIGLAVLVGGFPLARKFVTRLFTGNEVYVILTRNGQMEVYKNPNAPYVHEDTPLLMIPYDILESKEYVGLTLAFSCVVNIAFIASLRTRYTATRSTLLDP